MRDALRDELTILAVHGWALLQASGPSGAALIAQARTMGLIAEADDPTPPDTADIADASDTADSGVSAGPAALTVRAALLGELLDTYGMAGSEQEADANSGEPRISEARTALKAAMAAMRDEDWASLDRFPQRARDLRIATDHLRERFRDGPAKARGESPASVVTDCHAALTTLAFRPVPVPSLFLPAADTLVLARGTVGLVVGFHGLGGKSWSLEDGIVGRWQCTEDHARPDHGRSAPGRVLWQRLTLVRTLLPQIAAWQGWLIVYDGRIIDTAPAVSNANRVPDGPIRLLQQGLTGTAIPSFTDAIATMTEDHWTGDDSP